MFFLSRIARLVYIIVGASAILLPPGVLADSALGQSVDHRPCCARCGPTPPFSFWQRSLPASMPLHSSLSLQV